MLTNETAHVTSAAGFLYSLGKRLRTGSAATRGASDRAFPRTDTRDARGRSPVGRRPPDDGGREPYRAPRDRTPPRGGGSGPHIRGTVMRPEPAPRLHPDAARLLDTLVGDGRVRAGDVNERCVAALAEQPPAVQV